MNCYDFPLALSLASVLAFSPLFYLHSSRRRLVAVVTASAAAAEENRLSVVFCVCLPVCVFVVYCSCGERKKNYLIILKVPLALPRRQ